MVNTKIRLIILFFAAKDGEALYSQQKQDRELNVAQIMNSFLFCLISFKKKKKKLSDLFVYWLHWVFTAAHPVSLVLASGGYCVAVFRVLTVIVSPCGPCAVERRLSSCGIWA